MSVQPALAQDCPGSSKPFDEFIKSADEAFGGRFRGTGYLDDGDVYSEGGSLLA